jgi:hypothetical protein
MAESFIRPNIKPGWAKGQKYNVLDEICVERGGGDSLKLNPPSADKSAKGKVAESAGGG